MQWRRFGRWSGPLMPFVPLCRLAGPGGLLCSEPGSVGTNPPTTMARLVARGMDGQDDGNEVYVVIDPDGQSNSLS